MNKKNIQSALKKKGTGQLHDLVEVVTAREATLGLAGGGGAAATKSKASKGKPKSKASKASKAFKSKADDTPSQRTKR